jgi:hypothetical protein
MPSFLTTALSYYPLLSPTASHTSESLFIDSNSGSDISPERFRRTPSGVQLSVVTEKLNVVTDGGRRKLSVATDGTPEKDRRYYTFSHTERASVATIYLSDRMH